MENSELRVGNIFIGHDNKLFRWGLKEFSFIEPDVNISIDEIIKSPVCLLEDILLKLDFKQVKTKKGCRATYKYQSVTIHLSNSGNWYFKKRIIHLNDLQNIVSAELGQELDASKLIS